MSDHSRKLLTLGIAAVLLFLAGNHILSLTNPDEVFYTGTAKEMLEQKTWSVPYLFGQPQFEKPILTYWLIRVAFVLFGVTAFAARFFPAVFAALGVFAVYFFCVRVYGDRKKAFACAFVLMSSLLYVGLARTVFTDMIFSVLVGLALLAFYAGYHQPSRKNAGIVMFFVFSALAVLAKGLLGATMPFLAVFLFLFLRRELPFLWCRAAALGGVLFLLIAVPWYAWIIGKFGKAFIDEFYVNDHLRRLVEAEHESNDSWYFYPVTTLACFFPWTVVVAGSFGYLYGKLKESRSSPVYLFLACWIAAVFCQVQFAHSKLVSYIFPVYPALAILAGDYWRDLQSIRPGLARGLALASLGCFLVLPPAISSAAFKYHQYIPRPELIVAVMAVFCSIVFVQLLMVRRRVAFFPYAAAFNIVFLLFTLFAFDPWADDALASRNAAQYLNQQYSGSKPVLCSKMNVRGVRYYSGREAAVFKPGTVNFFSPHPIPFINSPEKLEAFVNDNDPTYAVLELKDIKRVRDILKNRYRVDVLKQFSVQAVARITREQG